MRNETRFSYKGLFCILRKIAKNKEEMPLVLEIIHQDYMTVKNRVKKTRTAIAEFCDNKNDVTAVNVLVWWKLLFSRLNSAYPFTDHNNIPTSHHTSRKNSSDSYFAAWINDGDTKFPSEALTSPSADKQYPLSFDIQFMTSFLDYLESDFLPSMDPHLTSSLRKV